MKWIVAMTLLISLSSIAQARPYSKTMRFRKEMQKYGILMCKRDHECKKSSKQDLEQCQSMMLKMVDATLSDFKARGLTYTKEQMEQMKACNQLIPKVDCDAKEPPEPCKVWDSWDGK